MHQVTIGKVVLRTRNKFGDRRFFGCSTVIGRESGFLHVNTGRTYRTVEKKQCYALCVKRKQKYQACMLIVVDWCAV